jgi:hypothetical protein
MDFTRFNGSDSVRFAYLRPAVLQKALQNEKLLDTLVRDLDVPGKPAVLKALSRDEKVNAINVQIEHFRSTKTSVWSGVSAHEVFAAVIFRSRMSDKYVSELFFNAKNERALLAPVSAWLRSKDLHVFEEVPMGACRVDVLGYRQRSFGERFLRGGLMGAGLGATSELVAIELKDDLAQMKRGLDQMATYGEYAHKVYLACTPFLAANFLDQHSEGVKVKHWDPDMLNRKLEQVGVGLLLVEGDQVYEYREPRTRSPDARKLEEVALALKGR